MSNEIWLVKSSGHVLGPYPSKIVIEKLLSGEISIIDEISLPLERWKYVRDEKIFLEVVAQVRFMQESSREITSTDTMTQPLDAITQTDVDLNDGTSNQFSKEKIIKPQVEVTRTLNKQSSSTFKNIEAQKDPSQDFFFPFKKWIFRFILVAIALLPILAYFHFNLNSDEWTEVKVLPKTSQDILMTQAFEDYRIGQYPAALEKLKTLGKIENNPDLILQWASLKIVLENNTKEAIDMLFQLMAFNQRGSISITAKVTLGLAYLYENNFKEAETQFTQALLTDNQNISSLLNMAIIKYLQNNTSKSIEFIDKVLSRQNTHSLALFLKVLNYTKIYLQDKNSQNLSNLENLAHHYLKNSYDFTQEVFILLIFLANDEKNEDKLKDLISLFWKSDPFLSEEHFFEILVFKKPFEWTELLGFCEKALENSSDIPSKAILSFCYEKSGKKSNSQNILQSLMAQAQPSALALALSSYLSYQNNENEEAMSLVNSSLKIEETLWGLKLKASLCFSRKDFNCASDLWNKVYQLNPKSLEALSGLALLSFQNKKFEDCKKYLVLGKNLSRNYKPLLALESKLMEEN